MVNKLWNIALHADLKCHLQQGWGPHYGSSSQSFQRKAKVFPTPLREADSHLVPLPTLCMKADSKLLHSVLADLS